MNTDEVSPPCKQASKVKPERVRASSSYRGALAKAAKVLKKPEKLARLLTDAAHKVSKLDKSSVGEAKEGLLCLFRLIRAYSTGTYRNISWNSLVLVVASVIYFVTPIDLIPDFLLFIGYMDDIAILTWTVKTISEELDKFRDWEKLQTTLPKDRQIEIADD